MNFWLKIVSTPSSLMECGKRKNCNMSIFYQGGSTFLQDGARFHQDDV